MALIFPPDLHNKQNESPYPFMLFSPFKWVTAGKRSQIPNILKKSQHPDESIALPLPNNGISDTIDSQWDEAENLTLQEGKDVGLKILKNEIQQRAGELFQVYQYNKGELLNDFESMAYGGVGFREFTFEFTLIPNNLSEAELISKIIKTFKIHVLPNYTENFIEYPSFFKIDAFFPHLSDSLINYKDCVATNMTTNYFPDQIMTVFKTGHPIKIDLSLTMKELDKVTSGDYK